MYTFPCQNGKGPTSNKKGYKLEKHGYYNKETKNSLVVISSETKKCILYYYWYLNCGKDKHLFRKKHNSLKQVWPKEHLLRKCAHWEL